MVEFWDTVSGFLGAGRPVRRRGRADSLNPRGRHPHRLRRFRGQCQLHDQHLPPTSREQVNAGPATHFLISTRHQPRPTAGTAFNFTVTAEDAYNNTATAYTGTVHFTSSDGQAVLPVNSTLTSGTGTFSVTLKTAGSQTLTATDTATSSITGASAAITVSPAAASPLRRQRPPGSVAASTAFDFTVTALDPYNNTATAYAGTVQFTSTDASATLPANSTLTSGVGTFTVTLFSAGNRTVTATDTATHQHHRHQRHHRRQPDRRPDLRRHRAGSGHRRARRSASP